MNLRNMTCCGLREITGLEFAGDGKEAMTEFVEAAFPKSRRYNFDKHEYEYIARLNFSHAVFSEAQDGAGSYGEKFSAYILKNKLGDVIASQRRVNPNSGNRLKVWIWTLNKQGLKKWAENNKVHQGAHFGVEL